MAPNLLKIHEQARDNLLERITQFLREDPRISAAWLTGSLAQGNADALSDLDLWLAIADPGFEEVKANRGEQIKAVGEPLIVLDQPNNAPPGGAFMLVMYAGPTFPLEVDWNWQAESQTVLPAKRRILFDRVTLPAVEFKKPIYQEPGFSGKERAARLTERTNFFWSMSEITAKKVARRETWNALTMLNMVGRTLEEVKWLLGIRLAPLDYTYEAWAGKDFPVHPAEQIALLKDQHLEMEALNSILVEAGSGVSLQAIQAVKQYYTVIEKLLAENISL